MAQFRVVGRFATAKVREGAASYVEKLLPPGTVIEGDLEPIADEPKRRRGYADKMVRSAEDKAPGRPVPARRPDPRLSNCVLEGGRSKAYPSAEDKG